MSDLKQNWTAKCVICDQLPTMGSLGLCGPCCTGDASTVLGNW